ncbi:homoserine O-acetyltransferase [Chitinophaga jiangningensis]|uniref:Homoserine O-acetyltransferase n=1 Tax=Chitinophaga jiangningensis TaxID=1419482 RepID=A0A1M7MQV8_9BACT|nr:homoserine O-acetyltransferase [Chitinophaga jiangningensis]SHM93438.1 homoserine O-acetyltransferase [Chitinophaga jiangningensis]
MSAKVFHSKAEFRLESGESLPELQIAYHTYGNMLPDGSNVVWICHALTANSDVTDWWTGLVGEGKVIDPNRHFIVCANILGSCYGTSGPSTLNPVTGKPWYRTFPSITIRDMVNAHILLRQHLSIPAISLLVGGSMGGYQAMEWALMEPDMIKRLFLLCTGAAESAWGIAIHTAQRLAIEADHTWEQDTPHAGHKGLKAARAIGMVTYRNYQTFVRTQSDPDKDKTDHFRASSYITYQGDKLVKRFNAQTYWLLSKAMDSHNIARGRHEDITTSLSHIQQPVLLIGITSDILCPPEEQQLLAQHLPKATYHEIDSSYGHDGFLIEFEKIGNILQDWI